MLPTATALHRSAHPGQAGQRALQLGVPLIRHHPTRYPQAPFSTSLSEVVVAGNVISVDVVRRHHGRAATARGDLEPASPDSRCAIGIDDRVQPVPILVRLRFNKCFVVAMTPCC